MLELKFHIQHKFLVTCSLDRGSETQLQVTEHLNFLAQCSKSDVGPTLKQHRAKRLAFAVGYVCSEIHAIYNAGSCTSVILMLGQCYQL